MCAYGLSLIGQCVQSSLNIGGGGGFFMRLNYICSELIKQPNQALKELNNGQWESKHDNCKEAPDHDHYLGLLLGHANPHALFFLSSNRIIEHFTRAEVCKSSGMVEQQKRGASSILVTVKKFVPYSCHP